MSEIKQKDEENLDISDEAFILSEENNGDTVTAEITGIRKDEDETTINFDVPLEGELSETLSWPSIEDDLDEYKIKRICDEYIGSFEAIEELKGEEVEVDPEDWKIKTEPEDKTDTVDYMRIAKNIGSPSAIVLAKYGFLFTILSMIGVIVLAFAMQSGVSIFTPNQLASIFLGGILLLICSAYLAYHIKSEQQVYRVN
jgi:hypothetical protein